MTLRQFALDPYGTNPANYVPNEVHELSNARYRVIVPNYGAFFTESVVVVDDNTEQPLIKGVDYKCIEMLQEATAKFNKELCICILIENQTVGNRLRVSYQCLGDHYQHTPGQIAIAYERLLQDTRPVDFTNITGFPETTVPTLHEHMLQDVYGFGPVVNAIERLKTALLFNSNIELEQIWQRMQTEADKVTRATYADIDSCVPSEKILSVDTFLYALVNIESIRAAAAVPSSLKKSTLTG